MRYLVAFDGFEQSTRALELARDQAEACDATVGVVHVVGDDNDDPESREQIRETVGDIMAERGVDYDLHFPTTTKVTHPATRVGQRLLEFADEHDADVIYLGNKQTGTAERMIVGSVVSTIVEDRSIPVVLVP